MPVITAADNTQLFYETAGRGRPLVFIHGWAMSGRVWHFQAETFAHDWQVIVPDLRGHGRSGQGSAPSLGMADFAADLVALFTALDLEGATLVGWSMGAQVVLEAFPALRERVAALVLVGGTPRFTATDDYPFGLPPVEARGMALRLKRDYSRTMGDFFKAMFAEGELVGEQYQRVVREIVIPGRRPEPEAAVKALAALTGADQRHQLAGIDRPALLVHGTADSICLPGASHFMAGQLSDATLVLLEGYGHAPFISSPALFDPFLVRFLERVYAGD
ncbi:alpha/beta fold hydrolase [Geobacter argillaceus]|uniref:Pimeloyl-[acyl-carrier protein] methyl ester esterase n=1 Tax=Geobacter argillaceus TaxID=345631 RepID=A0A562WR89_9BACT|nr:alpha/beta fold hydrolase [Geobacter argillaceus]TWJ32758.1 pimeloyl-[acyl-carrier protein] methyl ester esterase [Geobacter argillaceus]